MVYLNAGRVCRGRSAGTGGNMEGNYKAGNYLENKIAIKRKVRNRKGKLGYKNSE